MAYDEVLAERVRELLAPMGTFREMKMFGGLGVMRYGHMCCGLWRGDNLILRLGPEGVAQAMASGQARPFEPMKGKPATGMCMIEAAAELDDEPLQAWLARAVAYAETLPPKG